MPDQPPTPLTVGELKKQLDGVPGDTLVVLLEDDAEARYTSGVTVERGVFAPFFNTAGQFCEDPNNGDDDTRGFYEEFQGRDGSTVAIGLTPTNLC